MMHTSYALIPLLNFELNPYLKRIFVATIKRSLPLTLFKSVTVTTEKKNIFELYRFGE